MVADILKSVVCSKLDPKNHYSIPRQEDEAQVPTVNHIHRVSLPTNRSLGTVPTVVLRTQSYDMI